MPTRSLRYARFVLLVPTLVIAFTGLALAERAPVCADRQASKACAARMSVAPQPALTPVLAVSDSVQKACFWAWYEEYWKDGEICRWYNSCTGERWGSCPNGYDYRTNEIFPCC